MFQQEAYLLAAVLFYVAFYFIGKGTNVSRAHKWYVSLPIFMFSMDSGVNTQVRSTQVSV